MEAEVPLGSFAVARFGREEGDFPRLLAAIGDVEHGPGQCALHSRLIGGAPQRRRRGLLVDGDVVVAPIGNDDRQVALFQGLPRAAGRAHRHRMAVFVQPEGHGVGRIDRSQSAVVGGALDLPGGQNHDLGRVGGQADGREHAGIAVLPEVPVVAGLLAGRWRRSRLLLHYAGQDPVAMGNRQRRHPRPAPAKTRSPRPAPWP